MIPVVVFDLGGVLIDWDPRHLYRKLIADPADMEWFLSNVCNHDWNHQQDAGRSWKDGVSELSARYPEYAYLIHAYSRRWPEMLRGEVEETVSLLKSIRAQGARTYVLSNWSKETFVFARRKFGFLDLFDGIQISGEVGVAKPDKDAFEICRAQFGFSFEEAIFIDDQAENVAVASGLGMQSHLYRDSPGLRLFVNTAGFVVR